MTHDGSNDIIATNGEERSGLWGELLSTAAQARGVESVLTDGLVRDVRQMNAMGYHCFCKGYSPLDSAGRILAKTINQPITCGGVQVHPGDFILADYDGVAVIPAAIKGEVHKKAMEKLAGENVVRDELAAGQSPREVFDRYGIGRFLIATGYCDCWTLIDDCVFQFHRTAIPQPVQERVLPHISQSAHL